MRKREFSIAVNCWYIVLSILVVFVLAMLVLHLPNMRSIDYSVLHAIQNYLFVFPYSYAKFISYFGCGNYWLWPRITAAAVMCSHKYYLKAFLFLIFTRVVFFINDGFIKHLVCRERPCGRIYGGYSFPSGHAAFTMCMCGILIYLVHKHVHTDWWRILLLTVLSLWIVLVALSRMWLNVHFPIDIIAGLCVGFALVNLYIILDKFFDR